MLRQFLVRVANYLSVWERAVLSIFCVCLAWGLSVCECASFPFGIEVGCGI